MSENIDNRIVEMKFNNQQFEKNIGTSTKSLEKMKQSLNFDSSIKSFNNLEKAANSCSFAGMEKGINALVSRFSTLGIVGIEVIQRIVNKALDAGKKIASALTVAPMASGYRDYITKLTSVQTIMNATGASLKVVNGYFKQLDTYADKTIYNLTDMTSAFAKFTNAGVAMDKSIPAIKGIANMVALAGQDAGAAQIAFYNLSQSISGGFLTTTDYKSLNLANVATKEWKDQMIQGALAAGTLKKSTDGLYSIPGVKGAYRDVTLFTEKLSDGWANTEVLLDVLGKYGDETTTIGKKAQAAAQNVKSLGMMVETLSAAIGTGWTDTFELLLGNVEESTRLFTGITNVLGEFISNISDARNEMFGFWKDNGGRANVILGIANVLLYLASVIRPMEDAFSAIFPPMTGQTLLNLSKLFLDFSEKLKLGDGAALKIERTFKGLFAVLNIGKNILGFVWKSFNKVVQALVPGSDGILSITANIGDFIVALDTIISKSDFFDKAIGKVGDTALLISKVIQSVTKIISKVLTGTYGDVGKVLENISTMIHDWISSFGGSVDKTTVFAGALNLVNDAFKNIGDGLLVTFGIIASIFDIFTKPTTAYGATGIDALDTSVTHVNTGLTEFMGTVSNTGNTIKTKLTPVISFLADKLKTLNFTDVAALLTGTAFLSIARTLTKSFKGINSIFKGVGSVLEGLGKVLDAQAWKIKGDAILKVAIALGILAVSLIALSFIDMTVLAQRLGILAGMLVAMVIALKVLQTGVKGTWKVSVQLVAIGASVLLLAAALAVIAAIPTTKLLSVIATMLALMVMITAFVRITNGGKLQKSIKGLVGFGLGILVLTGALYVMANIPFPQLMQGITVLGVLIALVAGFIKVTNSGDIQKSAAGIIGFSVGILILTGALSILAKLPFPQLVQGATALGVLIALVAGFIKVTNSGDIQKSATGIIGFSSGILILTGVLLVLANLPFQKLVQGGAALGVLIGLVAGFIKVTNSGDVNKSAAGLIGFSAGIVLLTGSLAVLCDLPFLKVLQGATALGVIIALVAGFIRITNGGDVLNSAVGMLAFSAGVTVLAVAVAILANIPFDKVATGVVSLGVIMLTIAAFTNVTKSGDIALSATGLVGFAAGLAVLAGTLAILSALDTVKLLMASAAVSVLLLSISVFAGIVDGKKLLLGSAGLIIFSGGVYILAQALKSLLKVNTTQLVVITVCLSALILVLSAFSKLTDSLDIISTGAGLLVFAVGIGVLAASLKALGSIDTKVLLIAGAALLAMMVLLGVASYALNGLSVIVVMLAASIALLGVAALAMGVGVLAGGYGLKLFIDALVSLVAVGPGLIDMLTKLMMLIPMLGIKIAEGVVSFARAIQNGMPTIMSAFDSLCAGLVRIMIKYTPEIVTAFIIMMELVLQAIEDHTPEIVSAGCNIVIYLLLGLVSRMPAIVEAGTLLMVAFIVGMEKNMPRVIQAGVNFVIAFINGTADGIRENTDLMIDAMENLVDAMIESGVKVVGSGTADIAKIGLNVVRGIVIGITGNAYKVNDAGTDLGNGLVTATEDSLLIKSPSREFKRIGTNITDTLANSVKSNAWKSALEASTMGKNVVTAADITKTSPMAVLNIGKNLTDSLANSITVNSVDPILAASIMAARVKGAVQMGLGGKQTVEMPEMDTSITGVLGDKLTADNLKKPVKSWADVLEGIANNLTGLLTKTVDKGTGGLTDGLASMVPGLGAGIAGAGVAVKTEFEKAVENIENEKYFDRMDLTAELAAWTSLKKTTTKGSDEELKTKKEIYRVEKEIRAKDYDDAIKVIEKEKSRNKINTEDEIFSLRLLRSNYDKGSAERIAINDKIYDAKQRKRTEDFNAEMDIIDDEKFYDDLSLQQELNKIKKLQKKYKDDKEYKEKLDKDAYTVAKEIKDKKKELDDDYYANSKSITDQLKSDIKDVNDSYTDALKSRTDELNSAYGLFDKIETPDAITGSELLSNLGGQVAAMTTWRSEIDKLSAKGVSNGLIDELEEMGPTSLSKIQALNTLTADQLSTYVILWQTKYHEAQEQAGEELEPMLATTKTQIQTLTSTAATELETYKQTWLTAIGEIVEGTTTKFEEPKWATVGTNIITTITGGVTTAAETLATAAANTATTAMDAATTAINTAVTNSTPTTSGVGESISAGIIASLQQAIINISDAITGKIDIHPTIRPVLDMTDVTRGLNAAFSKIQTLHVSVDKVSTVAAGVASNAKATAVSNSTKNTTATTKVTVTNYNTVRSDSDITKISQSLNKTLTKYNAAKGVLA